MRPYGLKREEIGSRAYHMKGLYCPCCDNTLGAPKRLRKNAKSRARQKAKQEIRKQWY